MHAQSEQLPSLEELKAARAAKIERLSNNDLPAPPKFAVDAMCDDVEAFRSLPSSDSASATSFAHQTVLASARLQPLLLARWKQKLCARWAQLALNSSDAKASPSRSELVELAPVMAECVQNVNHGKLLCSAQFST